MTNEELLEKVNERLDKELTKTNTNEGTVNLIRALNELRGNISYQMMDRGPSEAPMERPEYPYEEGNVVVIGPECFIGNTEDNKTVINYRGQNYVPQKVKKNKSNKEEK